MDIDIKRIGSRPSQKGPEDWFTGTVRIDPLFQAPEPARTGAAQVTFEHGNQERLVEPAIDQRAAMGHANQTRRPPCCAARVRN